MFSKMQESTGISDGADPARTPCSARLCSFAALKTAFQAGTNARSAGNRRPPVPVTMLVLGVCVVGEGGVKVH